MIPHPENLSRTPMDLQHATQHFRLLADPTRLRLLLLLNQEELSVAELSGITQLAQPRVSTHLARLKEAGLVSDRRDGVFVYYRIASAIADPGLEELWHLLRQNTDDPLIQQDLERIAQILTSRAGGGPRLGDWGRLGDVLRLGLRAAELGQRAVGIEVPECLVQFPVDLHISQQLRRLCPVIVHPARGLPATVR